MKKVVKHGLPKMQVVSGKGLPQSILNRIAAAKKIGSNTRPAPNASNKFESLLNEPFDVFKSSSTSDRPPPFSEVSQKLKLDEYELDEDMLDKIDLQLDVTALDRYNDDIRKHRRILLDECRLLPYSGDVDKQLLEKIRRAAFNLCRSCYYGTYKAQKLAEGSTVLIVWLLNRRNVPFLFHVKMLQSLSELVWASNNLKIAFLKSFGVPVIIRLMKSGLQHHTNLACWAAYTLLTATIGCGEIIKATQKTPQIDELIGEMTFEQYWRDWPANFGYILQGVIFGPHSVSAIEDEFVFR